MTLSFFLPFVLIPAAWLGLLSVRIHLAQDRILSSLYRDHREIWESLLRPCGWQWSPPGRMTVPWRMWSCPWGADPEWLARTPELRDEFRLIHALRRRAIWPMYPFVAVGIIIFALAAHFL